MTELIGALVLSFSFFYGNAAIERLQLYRIYNVAHKRTKLTDNRFEHVKANQCISEKLESEQLH